MSADYSDCEVTATSSMAIQVKCEELGTVWLPRSVIVDESEIEADAEIGDTGDLAVKSWFAENEGWPT